MSEIRLTLLFSAQRALVSDVNRRGDRFTQEDVMDKRLIAVTLAAIAGLASVANAQSYYDPDMTRGERRQYQREERYMNSAHETAITDEYGFRYDSRGDRLDASGHVMPPPVTPPGAPALR
jgi:hypothetical protein